MKNRYKMKRGSSKRQFSRGAINVNPANNYNPMRGGWRL